MKRFYLFALAAMLFAACATDDTQDLRPVDAPETLTVGFEEDTRIQLQNGKTVWTKGDLVSVFYRSNANQKWQYTDETGERVGNLKQVSAGSATETMKRVVIVYPYNENYYINTETYNVEATLPATQHYLADSYGLDGNIMISSGEYNQFSLKNVCGWLKLQLTGSGEKVQSISLRGNNDEQVAGQIYINSSDATSTLAAEMGTTDDTENSAGGNLVFEDTILTEVTLDCGEGVTLGAEATAFYIALPPQTFEKGVTVEITTTEGKIMGQYTDKEIVIERNTIQPMAELSFEEKIAANQIHYTSSDDTVVTPYKTDVFGANIVSNVCENGKGIITFDNKVTSIGEKAFRYCSSLTRVTIPDSITEIGRYAFSDCTSLTSVTIPDSVTSIESHAFGKCTSLTSVTIPNSVTSIGSGAFSLCSSLTAFYGKFASEDNRCLIINGTLNSFAPAGITSYSIPDSITEIGSYAFYGCHSLTRVTIGNGVTEIGGFAFFDCTSLTTITIPDSVTSIGENAFYDCTSLKAFYGKFASEDNRCLIVNGTLNAFAIGCGATSYTIPDSVTEIGGCAFQGCTSLTSVNIGHVVTTIGYGAFWHCTSLTSVTIPNSVTSIENTAFNGCTSLTSVTIPDSVTEIGGSAFSGCTSLTNVTIPDSVTEIGGSAFSGCTLLTSVTIPNSVTVIRGQVFCKCTSLTSVTIPDSVTSIGMSAFDDCTSLKEVYCKPTTPPTGDTWMFYHNASGRKIYVPASDDDSIINAYKANYYWSYYADYIFEYDFSAEQ